MKNIILLLIATGVAIGASMTVSAHAGRCKDFCNADYNICINVGGDWCEHNRDLCLAACDDIDPINEK